MRATPTFVVFAFGIIAQCPLLLTAMPDSDSPKPNVQQGYVSRVSLYCDAGNSSDRGIGTDNNSDNITFTFPLPDGFPNLSYPSEALTKLTLLAQGTPPESPPPPTVSNDTLISLRLTAFSSTWDVAFLTAFSEAISSCFLEEDSGQFELAPSNSQETLLELLNLSSVQSQIHAYSSNEALEHLNQAPVAPCPIYKFPGIKPTRNLAEILKSYFTYEQLRLGTLASMQTRIAAAGGVTAKNEAPFVAVFGGLLSSLSMRSGLLEAWLDSGTPLGPPTPFLVQGGRAWLYSSLVQQDVCDQLTSDLPVFEALKVAVPAGIKELQRLDFALSGDTGSRLGDLEVVYVNQQNAPLTSNVTNIASDGKGGWTFSADFPYQKHLLNGLTIAVLTNKTTTPFEDAEDVESATVAGPALVM